MGRGRRVRHVAGSTRSRAYAIDLGAARSDRQARRRRTARAGYWLVSAARTVVVALPILIFIPVIVAKMNYPGAVAAELGVSRKRAGRHDERHRVALFPTQFLEQFDWGNPQFYIENSLINRPMIYGLLGSEPSEGTDTWVRRAYRAAREGLPFSADMYPCDRRRHDPSARRLHSGHRLQLARRVALQQHDAHARPAPPRAAGDARARPTDRCAPIISAALCR